jgi:hypothetical protein
MLILPQPKLPTTPSLEMYFISYPIGNGLSIRKRQYLAVFAFFKTLVLIDQRESYKRAYISLLDISAV